VKSVKSVALERGRSGRSLGWWSGAEAAMLGCCDALRVRYLTLAESCRGGGQTQRAGCSIPVPGPWGRPSRRPDSRPANPAIHRLSTAHHRLLSPTPPPPRPITAASALCSLEAWRSSVPHFPYPYPYQLTHLHLRPLSLRHPPAWDTYPPTRYGLYSKDPVGATPGAPGREQRWRQAMSSALTAKSNVSR
jgi:hypothetical protein